MKIRIIAKPSKNSGEGKFDGELFWEENKTTFSPVEVICPIDGKNLLAFKKDWENFLTRAISSPPNKEEFSDKVLKKSFALEQMIFGTKSLPWKNPNFKEEIILQTDPEFTAFPWEILRTHKGYFWEWDSIVRGIRSDYVYTDTRNKNGFLILSNPVKKELTNSIRNEVSAIAKIAEKESKLPLKILKGENLKLIRFWEEISEASLVHYAGHTEKEGIPFEKENVILGKEIATAKLSNLKLVFLNSCHSAYESEHTGGLAASFLKAGANYVIGFLSPLETKIAEEVGERFWKEYLKSKDVYKSYNKTKQYLLQSDTESFLGGLSFVCFAPEKPKKNYTLITTIAFTFLVGIVLYSSSHFKKESAPMSREVPIQEEPTMETNSAELKPVTMAQKQTKTEFLISQIKNNQFRKEAESFLKEDHPLLEDNAREHILNEILQSDKTESLKYYEFKSKTGSVP